MTSVSRVGSFALVALAVAFLCPVAATCAELMPCECDHEMTVSCCGMEKAPDRRASLSVHVAKAAPGSLTLAPETTRLSVSGLEVEPNPDPHRAVDTQTLLCVSRT